MCICLIAKDFHPDYPIIILSNRDEFFHRPTLTAHFWEDNEKILAGRDLKDNGTWLGVTKTGKMGILTNYRAPHLNDPTKNSRGALITDFLKNDIEINDYLKLLKKTKTIYNGYNLIFGKFTGLYYYNNIFDIWSRLDNKINVVSNGILNDKWPKCIRLKKLFLKNISYKKVQIDHLFKILTDTKTFPDHELPDTGVGIVKERFLSPIFILGNDYGTRTSTIVLFNNRGWLQFIERTYKQGTKEVDIEKNFSFHIIN